MSRLYPGWGSNKNVEYEETFTAYSLQCMNRSELEAGDKVIMSQSTFRTVSRLKLPFPLTFKVINPRLGSTPRASTKKTALKSTKVIPSTSKSKEQQLSKKQAKPPAPKTTPKGANNQYCGVLEFSGPEEKVFLPQWMMKNIRVKDGQKVVFKAVAQSKIPKGTLCRLQPHTTAFIDLAASMDIRDLLEHAFRNYSVLSAGETIVVNICGENFKIDVIETQPEAAISLYGNLDLEVDFAPPLDAPETGRMRPQSREDGTVGGAPQQTKRELVGNNVMSFDQVEQFLSKNAEVGNKSSIDTTSAPAYTWGVGQSLDGSRVVKAPEPTPSSTPQSNNIKAGQPAAGPQPTSQSEGRNQPLQPRRKRTGSKFATRTGATFSGGGSTLVEKENNKKQSSTSVTTPEQVSSSGSLAVFTGEGRALQGGGNQQMTTPTNASTLNADAVRERRLQFLATLERKSKPPTADGAGKNGEAHLENNGENSKCKNNSVAVGSSLNAIRKAKV